MRLNGITAEPGTLIGWHMGEQRFLTVDTVDERGVEVRWSTQDELTAKNIEQENPRSVAEHFAITRKNTPYGLARWPLSKVPQHKTGRHLSTVNAQDILREHNPAVADQVYAGVKPKHVPLPPKLEIVQSIPDGGGKHRRGK